MTIFAYVIKLRPGHIGVRCTLSLVRPVYVQKGSSDTEREIIGEDLVKSRNPRDCQPLPETRGRPGTSMQQSVPVTLSHPVSCCAGKGLRKLLEPPSPPGTCSLVC